MKLKKAREDLLVMVFFAAFCAFLIFYVIPYQIPVPGAAEGQPFSPQTFPYLLAGGLTLCTVMGLVQTGRRYLLVKRAMAEAGEREEKVRRTKKEWLDALIPYIIYGVVIVYGLLFQSVGFILATVLVPPVILVILRDKKWYHYLIFYAFAALMYTVFKLILNVPLP